MRLFRYSSLLTYTALGFSLLFAGCPQDEPSVDAGDDDKARCRPRNEKTYYYDADGDGLGNPANSISACSASSPWVENADDCNDTVEGPGTVVSYADSDEDGLGDPDTMTEGCEAPEGHVLNDDDCDDTDSSIGRLTFYLDEDEDGYGNPDEPATSRCEPDHIYVDNNDDCDDGDFSITTGNVYYVDEDGDGYGVPDETTLSCSDEPPNGYAYNTDDCDDDDENIGATMQYVDSDQDGHGQYGSTPVQVCAGTAGFALVDDDCDDNDDQVVQYTYYLDDDDDGFGLDDTTVQACTVPMGYAEVGGDCNDDDETLQAPIYYADEDGDGFGDPLNATVSCSPTSPDGFSANDDDCDDSLAGVNPNAMVDSSWYSWPADDVDQNCDGYADGRPTIDIIPAELGADWQAGLGDADLFQVDGVYTGQWSDEIFVIGTEQPDGLAFNSSDWVNLNVIVDAAYYYERVAGEWQLMWVNDVDQDPFGDKPLDEFDPPPHPLPSYGHRLYYAEIFNDIPINGDVQELKVTMGGVSDTVPVTGYFPPEDLSVTGVEFWVAPEDRDLLETLPQAFDGDASLPLSGARELLDELPTRARAQFIPDFAPEDLPAVEQRFAFGDVGYHAPSPTQNFANNTHLDGVDLNGDQGALSVAPYLLNSAGWYWHLNGHFADVEQASESQGVITVPTSPPVVEDWTFKTASPPPSEFDDDSNWGDNLWRWHFPKVNRFAWDTQTGEFKEASAGLMIYFDPNAPTPEELSRFSAVPGKSTLVFAVNLAGSYTNEKTGDIGLFASSWPHNEELQMMRSLVCNLPGDDALQIVPAEHDDLDAYCSGDGDDSSRLLVAVTFDGGDLTGEGVVPMDAQPQLRADSGEFPIVFLADWPREGAPDDVGDAGVSDGGFIDNPVDDNDAGDMPYDPFDGGAIDGGFIDDPIEGVNPVCTDVELCGGSVGLTTYEVDWEYDQEDYDAVQCAAEALLDDTQGRLVLGYSEGSEGDISRSAIIDIQGDGVAFAQTRSDNLFTCFDGPAERRNFAAPIDDAAIEACLEDLGMEPPGDTLDCIINNFAVHDEKDRCAPMCPGIGPETSCSGAEPPDCEFADPIGPADAGMPHDAGDIPPPIDGGHFHVDAG